MTGIERSSRLMRRQRTDRIGVYEHFWGDTYHDWTSRGKIPSGESFEDHFGYDACEAWPFNLAADLDFVPVVVAEDEDTVTTRDQNHAILRRHKKHDSTPEHVGFTVDCRERWEELVKPKLKAESRRINFDFYRAVKRHAADKGRFFFWSGVNVFECIHPVCGHENMLMAMIEDPEWVHDMCRTYAEITVSMQQELFAKEGPPDGIWYYEDMGYKGAPFMSPAMYREFIQPCHKMTCDYAHSLGLPVMMHSCGFVEPLLPGMLEAGIDGLQVIEVKAGMDLLRVFKNYGERLSLMGGIDVRALYSNDRSVIDAELEAKIPFVKQGLGYFVHSDHSIPKTVEYETYRYFLERALELGRIE